MDPYKIKIGGVVADPYRIAIEYGLDPILGQALKKILRCGRKHKSAEEDAKEVITTMERWLEIQRERAHEASIESLRYAPTALDAKYPRRTPTPPPEAVPGGIAHYAGLTQEQIAERNRQCASKATVVGVDLANPSGDLSFVINPGLLGTKTNMEKILDERAGEANWP